MGKGYLQPWRNKSLYIRTQSFPVLQNVWELPLEETYALLSSHLTTDKSMAMRDEHFHYFAPCHPQVFL